ncbi:MAG: hypothetical protein JO115_21950 [Pseudonocardiales bacterium]|nr:hypothetical protein [Pseudonocardiales bacterium]
MFDYEGVEFRNGTVIIKWYRPSLSQPAWESYTHFDSFQEEHGHSQSGIVTYWIDPEPDTITDPSDAGVTASTTARPERETSTQPPPREENALGTVRYEPEPTITATRYTVTIIPPRAPGPALHHHRAAMPTAAPRRPWTWAILHGEPSLTNSGT